MQLFLGIDGGGTKTRCLVVDAAGNFVGSSVAGPANINTTPPEKVMAHLKMACLKALQSTAPAADKVLAACIALAGSGSESNREKLRAILANLPFELERPALLQTDVETAVNGAFATAPGIILIAGTGSICMAKDAAGKLHRSGGLGALIGDEGSGYWIGKKAIESAINPGTGQPLKTAILNAFNAASSAELTLMEYPLSTVAALCPIVMQLAASGDVDALKIIDAAIHELSELVCATQAKAGTQSLPLALMGGLIEGSTYFKNALIAAIERKLPGVRIQEPQFSALQGAVLTAHSSHTGGIDPSFLLKLAGT